MSTRRNFFKVLGLGAGVAAGGVVAAAAVLPDPTKQKAIKDIEDAGHNGKLTLGGVFGILLKPPPNTISPYAISSLRPNSNFVKETEHHVSVQMSVGSDGNLYLNQNGKWRRIVTE